jgi:hypothetical protein
MFLLLLYAFCSILCFVFEDVTHIDAHSSDFFPVIFGVLSSNYWINCATMLVASISFILYDLFSYNKADRPEVNEKFGAFVPLCLFIIISFVNIIATVTEGLFYLRFKFLVITCINLFAIAAYLVWCKFEQSDFRFKKTRVYNIVTYSSIAFLFLSGVSLSHIFLPLDRIQAILRAHECQKAINELSEELRYEGGKKRTVAPENIDDYAKKNGCLDLLKSGYIVYKKIDDTTFSLTANIRFDAREPERMRGVVPKLRCIMKTMPFTTTISLKEKGD